MRIALLGYGKMGKEIEKIALERKHSIVLKIDIDNQSDLTRENLRKADVAIDFSNPSGAYNNIISCFKATIPVVCGTTGWLDKMDEVLKQCKESGQSFFYASNYSIGMNVFFRLNTQLAKMMNRVQGYDVEMEEVHHIHKLDAPSGTAISLAEGIIENIGQKKDWKLNSAGNNQIINIISKREGEVPGTHSIRYTSEVDSIEIKHVANNRRGLALGAVIAAEYIIGKKGYHTMHDILKLGD
jgi:4-hydroxy-tetrahydrodipicolinate reductase